MVEVTELPDILLLAAVCLCEAPIRQSDGLKFGFMNQSTLFIQKH